MRAASVQRLLAGAMACTLAACSVSGAGGAGTAATVAAGAEGAVPMQADGTDRRPQLVDPRPLQGAGAVAFDPTAPRLAWAAGHELRRYVLDTGAEEQRLAIGHQVVDLGFAPDGALWVIADVPQLWRDGVRVCRADTVEADGLLAADAGGAVVAAYTHSDGVGMLRRQLRLDTQCDVIGERVDPVPAGVTDPGSDPGEGLGRSALRNARPGPADLAARLSEVRLPAGAGVKQAVQISPDGRWWVLEGAQGRTLWRLDRP